MVTCGIEMLHTIESQRQTAVDMSNHVGLYAKQRYDIQKIATTRDKAGFTNRDRRPYRQHGCGILEMDCSVCGSLVLGPNQLRDPRLQNI